MIIQILEDDAPIARHAKEMIEQSTVIGDIAVRLDTSVECRLDADLTGLAQNVPWSSTDWPGIVVLDMRDESNKVVGDRIYEAIRAREDKDPIAAAFVIVWTLGPAEPATVRMLSQYDSDDRLLSCPMKTGAALQDRIVECMNRLTEEIDV